jgi:hypothetical protein
MAPAVIAAPVKNVRRVVSVIVMAPGVIKAPSAKQLLLFRKSLARPPRSSEAAKGRYTGVIRLPLRDCSMPRRGAVTDPDIAPVVVNESIAWLIRADL